ncbi:hypothetical protein [Egbenema bharatensis]|uniref:hypothetical protein n=1 Tax=Egbenema bharatensis TaxID=3463334 RepID=UPI003A897471
MNRDHLMRLSTAVLVAAVILPGAIGFTGTNPSVAQEMILMPQADLRPKGQRAEGRRRTRIDFAVAAAQLETTEAELKDALGISDNREEWANRMRLRWQTAATELNVTEAQLQAALGITIDPETGRFSRPPSRPNLETAAADLGVTEAQLRSALGRSEHTSGDRADRARGNRSWGDRTERTERMRQNLQQAATRLGVTEEQLIEALRAGREQE